MRQTICALVGALLLSGVICAQQPFPDGAVLEHHSGFATVQAKGARTLDQALDAIREEYGWVVDYEDPPYQSQYDVGMIPWPAHPGSTWKVPTGSSFKSTYPEAPEIWSSTDQEEPVLSKVVFDYNQGGGPGNFTVREQSDGSYAVVGESVLDNSGNGKSVSPILDTPISIPAGTRDALATVRLIADALSHGSSFGVLIGTVDINGLIQTQVTIGASNMPARDLLLQAIDATKQKMVWDLLFDPQHSVFVLNISQGLRARYDAFGKRSLIPITMPRVSPSP